jgi:hypothetical protein
VYCNNYKLVLLLLLYEAKPEAKANFGLPENEANNESSAIVHKFRLTPSHQRLGLLMKECKEHIPEAWEYHLAKAKPRFKRRQNFLRFFELVYEVEHLRLQVSGLERAKDADFHFEESELGSKVAPNDRFQNIYNMVRNARRRAEISEMTKKDLNKFLRNIFHDLDRNIQNVSETIIRERYQLNVRLFLVLPFLFIRLCPSSSNLPTSKKTLLRIFGPFP